MTTIWTKKYLLCLKFIPYMQVILHALPVTNVSMIGRHVLKTEQVLVSQKCLTLYYHALESDSLIQVGVRKHTPCCSALERNMCVSYKISRKYICLRGIVKFLQCSTFCNRREIVLLMSNLYVIIKTR